VSSLYSKSHVIYINNQYREQREIDYNALFYIRHVSRDVQKRQRFIERNLENLQDVIASQEEPKVDIGRHCRRPLNCSFISYCWKEVPHPSIFDLKGVPIKTKFELFHEGKQYFEDAKDDLEYTEKQQHQIEVENTGVPYINKVKLREFLDQFIYPISYLDFEAIQAPVPLYNGDKPFQQIPFQFSLHIHMSPNETVIHREFLASENEDPRPGLAEALLKNIPQEGSIIAYNSSFEGQVFSQLGELFPDKKERFMQMKSRLIDLMIPFLKQYIYTKEMQASHSIKKIAPALVPELSYEELDIPHGEMAGQSFLSLNQLTNTAEKDAIKQALLTYCKLDTFSMVKLVEVLTSLSS